MAKIQPKKREAFSVEDQEESLKKLKNGGKKNVKRITLDLPVSMFEKIAEETEATGQTYKGFFMVLAAEYFARKEG